MDRHVQYHKYLQSEIAQVLMEQRLIHSYSKRDLANKLGLSYNIVISKEKGKSPFSINDLILFGTLYDLSPSEIIEEAELRIRKK